MSVQDVLRQYGILDPDLTVRLADQAALSYAAAGVVLMKETGGGRNVWGHDGVNTGGIYTKGAEVDMATYQRYRSARNAGQIGSQGVGPVQLTWHGFQDLADSRGGCWKPEVSTLVGFETLGAAIRATDVWHAALKYNGAAPYADDFQRKYNDLVGRLRGQATPGPVGSDTLPSLAFGNDGSAVLSLQQFMVRTFPAYNSYGPNGHYGPMTAAGLAEFQRRSGIIGGDGRNIGPQTKSALWNAGWRG